MTLISALRFRLAAWQNNDDALAPNAVPLQALADEVAGKRVALIGNARALSEMQYGDNIDACDVVIRINRAPMPSASSHGTRTDWLALATSFSQVDYEALGAQRLIWMSHKRKRVQPWMPHTQAFTFFPKAHYTDVKTKLSAPPTTGALLIDFLRQTQAREINLFGFDFFASLSLSGARTADKVPHDFMSEGAYVRSLMETTPKLRLHPMDDGSQ